MNGKIKIFSFSLLGALLFGITFQSVHSFEHLVEQLSKEHCQHKYDHRHAVISHSHQDFDDCFVCDYSFSNYITITFNTIDYPSVEYNTTCLFGYVEKLVFFTGSLINLRGPPQSHSY
jgi:hypothetical protein